MRFQPPRPCRVRAFTLVELLVVLAVIAILIAGVTLSFRGINSSGQFNKALGEITELLDQGHSYAIAQNTYVWIVLYQNTPANGGPLDVYVAAFASSDGTDPLNWTGSVTLPGGTVGTTTFNAITPLHHYTGLHLETDTLPSAPTGASFPASLPSPPTVSPAPNFQMTGQSSSGPVALSGTSSVYWVIQFTPTGAAHVSANPVDSIWLGLQPSYTPTTFDPKNIASLKVNGLTGLTTSYRR